MKHCLLLILFSLLLTQSLFAQTYDYRHPWYAPFSQTSIWNTPIGSGATLVNANLPSSYYVCVDEEWQIRVNTATSTSQPVNTPSAWGTRWPGNAAWWQGTMFVPNSLIIPDAAPPSTPNACATFLMPDKETLIQLEPACRAVANQPIVGYRFGTDYSIFSAGPGGTHFGSSLSAFGGSIRLGELTGTEPIRHALKLNIWGNYLYYSGTNPGFRWPATTTDGCASTCYTGTNPKMVMGTLVTIPQSVTATSLGLTTTVAQKLLTALKNYGAYIVDNSDWDDYDWSVEKGVIDEVQTQLGVSMCNSTGSYHADMQKLIAQMKIVDNNTASTVGGGGTPVTSLAKPFCTEAMSIAITPVTIAGTNKKYKIPYFQASTYQWTVVGGTIVSYPEPNSIIINWGTNTSGTLTATVSNEYINLSTSLSVLPIELMRFEGRNIGSKNILTWQTATESNFSHFDLERSNNGKDFIKIGEIKAKGTNANYQFEDNEAKGNQYYRLKINDLDASFEYSKIIAIQSKNVSKVRIYPSITNGFLSIENAASYEVVNTFGQFVLSNFNLDNLEKIDISTLPNGIYFISGLDIEGTSFLEKIVKQ